MGFLQQTDLKHLHLSGRYKCSKTRDILLEHSVYTYGTPLRILLLNIPLVTWNVFQQLILWH